MTGPARRAASKRRNDPGTGNQRPQSRRHRPVLDGARLTAYDVLDGVSSVAVPLRVPGHLPAALAVVYATRRLDVEALGRRLAHSAGLVAAQLGRRPDPADQ